MNMLKFYLTLPVAAFKKPRVNPAKSSVICRGWAQRANNQSTKNNRRQGKQMNIKLLVTGMACIALVGITAGCSSVMRGTPVAGVKINANMDRTDYEVLGTTEGKSTKTSVLCGLVQVIDGSKVAILGIKFFEDQYAYFDRPWYQLGVSTEDRAYYKALAVTPDADSVAGKAYVSTRSGIPLLWMSSEVTFQGNALKYKPHN